jgi:hypothetical protein
MTEPLARVILPNGQVTLIYPEDYCCAGCILSARPCRIPCRIAATLIAAIKPEIDMPTEAELEETFGKAGPPMRGESADD